MAKKIVSKDTSLGKDKKIEMVNLSDLDFDPRNPRFGIKGNERKNQTDILDFIVRDFSIDDVLSSISVNGYFTAEPLICREQSNGRLTVMEGNRRLAACLVLSGDPRAANQTKKRSVFLQLQQNSHRPEFAKVPIIRFGEHEQERDLLSYLGVRHIAASQGWDSYAKANWISRAVEEAGLTLSEISTMTGDQNKTVQRLLEGFYFINQLIESGDFIPGNCARKGRGSNPEFPFSWIYTLLYYPKARKFVGLPDGPKMNPVPKEKIKSAAMLITRMLGDKTQVKPAAIDDSRNIGNLAAILDDPEKVELLSRGETVENIDFETLPIEKRLQSGLTDCKDILGSLVSALEATPPSSDIAENYTQLARQVNNLANSVAKKLLSIQTSELE